MNFLHIRARQFLSYCFWTSAPGEWVCATALYQWNLSFLQPFVSPGHKPNRFSKPAGLGVQFFSGGPKGWGSSCGSPGLHSSGRNSTFVRALLIEGHHMKSGYFIETMSLLLLPMLIFCCGAVWLGLRITPELLVSFVVVDLACPWEEVSSGTPYTAILNCSLPTNIFLSCFLHLINQYIHLVL